MELTFILRALVFGTFAFRFPFAFTSHMALPHVFSLVNGQNVCEVLPVKKTGFS